MNERKSCHSGHRERLRNKFIFHRESLKDHELLELLLFYSIPRKDTNEIAHNLCNVFGNINGVISAERKALLSFDGIGDNSVALFGLISEILNRAKLEKERSKEFFSFSEYRDYVLDYFSVGLSVEEAAVMLLDKEHKLIATVPLNYGTETKVTFSMESLLDLITSYKPKFLVLAHNHLRGPVIPSIEDDICTSKINLICFMHGVKLLDHIIVSKSDFYSYFQKGRIKAGFSQEEMEQILNSAKEISNDKC